MKKLRFFLALYISKAARLAMIMLGRNATHLPGVIAVKICPDFMGHLKLPKTVIAVTGTNGKTTVSNLLSSVLTTSGYKVTNNSLGSNIQAGIATVLLTDSDLLGRSKKDIAVLEVDERSSLLIYPYVKPDYLICNNLMRDSLKRNAHTEFIQYIINRALPETTKLILNADDPVCCGLGKPGQDTVYFGLDIEKPEISEKPFVQDIVYCPKCGGELKADYIRYNHIGRFSCCCCDYASPAPDLIVTNLDRENCTFTVSHHGQSFAYKLPNDNIVNVYNSCSVVALLHQLGLEQDTIARAFDSLQIVKFRFNQTDTAKGKITLQASKGQNPIACARSFSYVATCPGNNKLLFILVDDKPDNTGNSENVCWLYDCDYSYLTHESIGQIVFSGPRCKDHYLRALIAGVAPEKIILCSDFSGGAHLTDVNAFGDIYILHDVYLGTEANRLKDKLVVAKEGA